MASITFDAGRLLCRPIRNYLDSAKFQGGDIEYIESKGWLSRQFTIKGSDESLRQVRRDFDEWLDDNDIKCSE